MTYFWNNHHKEDLQSLAACPFIQNPQQGPSCGVTVFTCGLPDEIHNSGHCREAEALDLDMIRVIRKDVRLGGFQHSNKSEAGGDIGDVRSLVTGGGCVNATEGTPTGSLCELRQ